MDSQKIDCSIVIPTRNRYTQLSEALETFANQTYGNFEVVVVVDGSDDDTAKRLRETAGHYPFPLRVVESDHRGPAFARNRGADASHAKIVLFVGDDCLSDPKLVETHVRTLGESPAVGFVQGLTLWHPDVATPFQQFLYTAGYQAGYENLKTPDGSWQRFADWFCMTTNFSARRELFLKAGGFDEQFTDACWEDVEFGIRLAQHFGNAKKTALAPEAVNYHHHRYDLRSYAGRQYREGRWRLALCEKLPGAAKPFLDPEKSRMAIDNDWRKMIEAHPLLQEQSTSTHATVTAEIEKGWRAVLDTATYQGVNDACLERGNGWQFLPMLDNSVDRSVFVEALLEIESRPTAALSGDKINRLESSKTPWLAPALRAIALARLGRTTEAEHDLNIARRWHPDLTLNAANGVS